MAGIYLHIPFCYSRCSYCDFYKSTDISQKSLFTNALLNELEFRKDYLYGEQVDTIYFGGGTPSVLDSAEIGLIFRKLYELFKVNPNAEITFEANPDDLTPEYLSALSSTPVNRLSIGIQSFFDESLQLMRRRHNSRQAARCVEDAFRVGFGNISIDLIYGLPGLTAEKWGKNLDKAFGLPVCHLSAYHLTYHEGTHFYDLLGKGSIHELGEDDSATQFDLLIDSASKHNFGHYEISNFAKEGKISKHNYGYWFGQKYLGVGPSAHSYNQTARSWNVSDLFRYIKEINSGGLAQETEILSVADKFNDYIITRLRTKWGISEKYVGETFGPGYLGWLKKAAIKYISGGFILNNQGQYILARKGYFVSDKIMEDLIKTEQ